MVKKSRASDSKLAKYSHYSIAFYLYDPIVPYNTPPQAGCQDLRYNLIQAPDNLSYAKEKIETVLEKEKEVISLLL